MKEQNQSRIHLRIESLGQTEEEAYLMLADIALTYRTYLTTLAELFKMDANTLYNKLIDHTYSKSLYFQGLNFLFYGEVADQSKASQKVLAFYIAWQKASGISDDQEQENEKKKLRSLVKSLKGARALEKLKTGETLSEEEMLLVCKYQIRYGMTYDNLDIFLEKDSSGYTQRLSRILPKYPSLKKHYDLLLEYNKHRGKDSYIKNSGGRS